MNYIPAFKQVPNNKSMYQNPDNIQLPKTPKLPLAKVKLPWLDESIQMKVLMFYHSDTHIFGCQFSNTFYSPFNGNTRYIIPTKDKTLQTLMNYEKENLNQNKNKNDDEKKQEDNNNIDENIIEFKSSENVFQSAKARNKIDALFVQSLGPGDAARAGQARLIMSESLAKKYKEFGGEPFKIKDNHWQFSENDKRYKVRDNWHSYKKEIMNYALRLKFKRYYKLIAEYVDSEIPIFFIEHTENDDHWGDGNDGNGTNFLGKYLTALCWEFRLLKKDKKDINKMDVKDIKWKIDTMGGDFKKWLKVKNVETIENGKTFYEENKDCEWLK